MRPTLLDRARMNFHRNLPALTPAGWLRFDAIRRGLSRAAPSRILEVGAGEGALATWLAHRFAYVGIEPDPLAFAVASQRLRQLGSGQLYCLTTSELEDEGVFDLVCAFEVLEHIEDDVEEMMRWRTLLGPRGYVLVSVPAHRSRFGRSDEAVGHYRRYDYGDLEALLSAANFHPVWIESWGIGLGHLLEFARHRMASKLQETSHEEGTARSGRWMQPHSRLVRGLGFLASLPFRILQYPFRNGKRGIGWVALAQKTRADGP